MAADGKDVHVHTGSGTLCIGPDKVSDNGQNVRKDSEVSEKVSEIIKLSISQEFISASVAVVPGKKSATLTDDLGPKTFRIYKVKR